MSEIRLRPLATPTELYRAEFDGATPQVRLRDGRVLIQYRRMSFEWRKRKATVGLNATIPWSIEIVGGVQRVEADLREVDVTRFEVIGGAERIQLELGRPRGDTIIRVVGGVSTVRLERPSAAPVRLSISGGSQSVELDGMQLGHKGGKATVQSPGWGRATDRYDVEVIGGSRTLEIVGRP